MNESARLEPLGRLRDQLGKISDLNAAQALLGWDQETYMPAGAVEARAQQLATLGRMAHEMFTSEQIGRLLAECEPLVLDLADDSDDARLLRVTRRDYDKATKLPADLVAELAKTTALAQQAWKEARASSDFPHFQPHLERVLELVLRKAEAYGYEASPYDALLDEYEPQMRTARVADIFGALREQLVPIVQAIGTRPAPDDAFLHRRYPEQAQLDFGLRVVKRFGFDFDRGRQDRSAHPFSTSFSTTDVRITTRVQPDFLPSALFGTLHEAGHGLYEQGVDPALERTPLAAGTSLGMHESQSRLWENLVGRSRPFWRFYYPRLREVFPEQLGAIPLETFYRGINRVAPSLIRVEADEVTYNLHIMVRFELEVAMVSGELGVAELPEAWNAKMDEVLGLTPRADADGVLQDIHWSLGAIGYFPTYTLGNLISAQLFARASEQIDGLHEQLAAGRFDALLGWLRDRVHRHGRKFTASELLHAITGGDLEAESWLAYIRRKYGEIYDL